MRIILPPKKDCKYFFLIFQNIFFHSHRAFSKSVNGIILLLTESVSGGLDIDAMQKEFEELVEFWKKVYLRREREDV